MKYYTHLNVRLEQKQKKKIQKYKHISDKLLISDDYFIQMLIATMEAENNNTFIYIQIDFGFFFNLKELFNEYMILYFCVYWKLVCTMVIDSISRAK